MRRGVREQFVDHRGRRSPGCAGRARRRARRAARPGRRTRRSCAASPARRRSPAPRPGSRTSSGEPSSVRSRTASTSAPGVGVSNSTLKSWSSRADLVGVVDACDARTLDPRSRHARRHASGDADASPGARTSSVTPSVAVRWTIGRAGSDRDGSGQLAAAGLGRRRGGHGGGHVDHARPAADPRVGRGGAQAVQPHLRPLRGADAAVLQPARRVARRAGRRTAAGASRQRHQRRRPSRIRRPRRTSTQPERRTQRAGGDHRSRQATSPSRPARCSTPRSSGPMRCATPSRRCSRRSSNSAATSATTSDHSNRASVPGTNAQVGRTRS